MFVSEHGKHSSLGAKSSLLPVFFFTACKLSTEFTFSNGWGGHSKRILCDKWQLYEVRISLFINKSFIGIQTYPFI